MVPGLIVLATMLVWVPIAIAAPNGFEFTSTVVSVESAFLGVQPGDSVVGRYIFESTTPSTSADPTVGRYEPIAGTFNASIPISYIEVINRLEIDRYTAAALSGMGNGALQFQSVLATNQHLDAFTTVDLPLSPPPLSPFENNQFILDVSEGPNNFIHRITASPIDTLERVPESGTLGLIAPGSLVMILAPGRCADIISSDSRAAGKHDAGPQTGRSTINSPANGFHFVRR